MVILIKKRGWKGCPDYWPGCFSTHSDFSCSFKIGWESIAYSWVDVGLRHIDPARGSQKEIEINWDTSNSMYFPVHLLVLIYTYQNMGYLTGLALCAKSLD